MTRYALIEHPDLLNPSNPDRGANAQLDITKPNMVEVSLREDGKVLWINVDGRCVLRCCQIENLSLSVGGTELGEVIDGNLTLLRRT